MEAKVFWKSKTFIIGGLAPIILAALDAWANGQDARQIVAVAMAALMVVLRRFTSNGMVFALQDSKKRSCGDDCECEGTDRAP